MRHKFKLAKSLILVCMLLSSAGCLDTVDSEDVNPRAIYQSYHVDYDEKTNETDLFATFRVGGSTGTTVRLNSPSELRVNGRRIDHYTFLGTPMCQSQNSSDIKTVLGGSGNSSTWMAAPRYLRTKARYFSR